jgi:hypothetical protein
MKFINYNTSYMKNQVMYSEETTYTTVDIDDFYASGPNIPQVDSKEIELCKLLVDQIKNESNTIETCTQLFNKYLTPEGELFISKFTKERQKVRNALLDSIEKSGKAQENSIYIKASVILKDKLLEINRIYYNSIEFMGYLMFSGKEEGEEMLKAMKIK